MPADSSPVLIISGADDPTANAVAARLRERDASVAHIDTGDFPQRMRFTASISNDSWCGRIILPDVEVELDRLRSVYYRRPTRFTFPERMSTPDTLLAAAEARHGLGGVLAALDTVWVNDPSLTARAEYKPLQLRVAREAGLAVPPTLVTNDLAAAAEFADSHGRIVCKPLSSVVLGDHSGQPLISYTTPVDVTSIDPEQFSVTTNLLQRWVPKRVDCRVTMVGDHPFGVAIETESTSGLIDWRTDYAALTYHPIEIPDSVVAGMRTYLRGFDLRFAAFDFGVDHDGTWWFYEANPNGEWFWIEHQTGLEISARIADLLLAGHRR